MGWWEGYDGTVIGDELADLVEPVIDKMTKEMVAKWPKITRDQVLHTIAFCSGYLKSFDKDRDIQATVAVDKILAVMTVEQMRNWNEEHRIPPDSSKRVAPGTELINVKNPFTGDDV